MRDRFVVLVRHGDAEERGATGDFDRKLTESGVATMKDVGRALAAVFPNPDAIYASPLVRAMQTAQLIAAAYVTKPEIHGTDALRSDASVDDFLELMDSAAGERLICAGHEPNLSMIAAELTGGRIVMKKGSCCAIRLSSGSATLEWLVPPNIWTSTR